MITQSMLSDRAGKNSLYETVVQYLEQLIADSGLKPGEKLPSERELVEKTGVSRTIMREALRVLEAQGVLSIFPGKGVYVRRLGIQTVVDPMQRLVREEHIRFEHLIAARFVLEPELVRIASQAVNDDILAQLKNDLALMRKNVGNSERFLVVDQNFHEHLAVATQNPVFVIMMKPIIASFLHFAEILANAPSAPELAIERHQEIINAMQAHDAEAACQAMKIHLEEVEQQFRTMFTGKYLDLENDHDEEA
jgi:GntR family transcriptional repressor for pyruvate dehydrogenase complex